MRCPEQSKAPTLKGLPQDGFVMESPYPPKAKRLLLQDSLESKRVG